MLHLQGEVSAGVDVHRSALHTGPGVSAFVAYLLTAESLHNKDGSSSGVSGVSIDVLLLWLRVRQLTPCVHGDSHRRVTGVDHFLGCKVPQKYAGVRYRQQEREHQQTVHLSPSKRSRPPTLDQLHTRQLTATH